MLRTLHLPHLVCTLLIGALAGCASQKSAVFHPEQFDSTETYSRSFAASTAQTCEAARRALLSQGYVINAADAELVNGRKSFQPQHELHVEVEFRVACAAQGSSGDSTIAFVSALQDRYALKKSNNSASLGVGAFGSLSLPFTSSDDALVKVASETLTGPKLYEGFFALLQRYLAAPPQPAPDARASNHEASRAGADPGAGR